MNEQFEENGLVEEEIEYTEEEVEYIEEDETIDNSYHFSWRKMFAWVSILMALSSPLIAIGVSLICMNTASPKEKKEVSILCYIACGISAFLLIFDFITRFI